MERNDSPKEWGGWGGPPQSEEKFNKSVIKPYIGYLVISGSERDYYVIHGMFLDFIKARKVFDSISDRVGYKKILEFNLDEVDTFEGY